MPTRRTELARAIGGKWLVYIPPYAWLLPLWWSGSLLSTPNLSGWGEFWILGGVSLVALAIICLLFLLFRVTIWRRSLTGGSTPVWVALAGGVILGSTKAIVTVVGMSLVGTSVDTGLGGRVLASSVLGAIIVVAVPLGLSQLEKYRTQRGRLITALAQSVPSGLEAHSNSDHSTLTEFIEHSLRRLSLARSHPEDVVEILEDMRENDIRPLSHRIWKREHQHITDFTLINLITVSLSTTNFVAWPVAVGFIFLIGPSELTAYGFARGLAAIAIATAIIFVTLGLAKFLPPGGKLWGVVVFVICNLAMTSAIGVATTLLFGPIPTFLPIQANLAVLQVLATLTLFTSVYHLTRNTRRAIEDDLLRINPSLPLDAHAQAVKRRADRDLAELLHSQVQNVFLAKAVELKSTAMRSDRPKEEIRRATIGAIDDLEMYLKHLLTNSPATLKGSLDALLADTASTWQPVISVRWRIRGDLGVDLSQHDNSTIVSVITEGITNAVRHGFAREVDVTVSLGAASIVITVDDDGVGPRGGAPGLGSQLFSSGAVPSWALTTDSPLGGARLTVERPR